MPHRRWIALAFVVACAATARAGDPPAPPKHENKVSPEAKAAIDRFDRLVYLPADHGLVSAKGQIVPLGFTSRDRLWFDKPAKEWTRVSLPSALDREMRSANFWIWPVKDVLYLAFEVDGIFDYDEMDADVVVRDGVTVVTATEYTDGKATTTDEFVLGADGLLTRRVHRAVNGSDAPNYTQSFGWSKVGEVSCVASMDIRLEEANPTEQVFTLHYADVGGMHLPTSYEMTVLAKDAAQKQFSFHVADLVVNDKKVDLPAPWKHVNKVTPDAAAAMERYTKLTYRPAEHGLASAAGVVVSNLPGAQGRIDFKYVPPGGVAASAPPDMKPSLLLVYVRMPMGFGWEGFSLPGAGEYDAEFAEEDGHRRLVLATFRDGAPIRRSAFVFDDDGLVATVHLDGEPELRLTWGGAEGRRTIERIDSDVPVGAAQLHVTYTLQYADAGDLHLLAGYSIEGTSAGVRKYLISFGVENLVLNGKPVALPAPRRRENKITPEARAAIEAYGKLVYRPADHGLRSASGTLVPGGIRFAVTPEEVGVRPPDDAGGSNWATIANGMQPLLRFLFTGVPIADSKEFDAEFAEEQGRRVLVVTTYAGGVATQRSECFLDDRGLVATMRVHGLGAQHASSDFRFVWTEVGAQWQVERVECWDPSKPPHVTVAVAFAEVSGVRVPVSLKWMVTNIQGAVKAPVFAVHDFVLNGAEVALPKVALHENDVSPEAQTLMDAYARLVLRPAEHGLVTASGAFVPDGAASVRRRFSYSAPLFVWVTLPPEAKPESPAGKAVISSTRLALLLALDGIRLAESLEYDAGVVERDGVRILAVTEFVTGARTATSEFTFDAAGLVASLRRRDGADPAAPTSDVTYRLEWEKTAAGSRIRSAELSTGAADHPIRKRYSFTFSTIGGVDFVTSYTVALSEAGAPEKLYSYRAEDLVLNGTKVAVPMPGGSPK